MGFIKDGRPVIRHKGGRADGIVTSTAASTALDPRGVISMATTSTDGTASFRTLSRLPKTRDEFYAHASLVASSSSVISVIAASGSFFGSSSQDQVNFAYSGDGAHFIALSTVRWACVGAFGASFSVST